MDGTTILNFILSFIEAVQGAAGKLLRWFSSPLEDLRGGSTLASFLGVSGETQVFEVFFGTVLTLILVCWIIKFIWGLLPI